MTEERTPYAHFCSDDELSREVCSHFVPVELDCADCREEMMDVIGQNGNDGEVYKSLVCKDCGCYLNEENWWPSWRKSNNQRCIKCGRSRHKAWDSPIKSKDRYLKRKYGISYEEYMKYISEQDGSCYICGTTDPGGPPQVAHFCVDHCHKSGQVRKLLCANCNTGLGMFRDSPDLLRIAASYLEEHQEYA